MIEPNSVIVYVSRLFLVDSMLQAEYKLQI